MGRRVGFDRSAASHRARTRRRRRGGAARSRGGDSASRPAGSPAASHANVEPTPLGPGGVVVENRHLVRSERDDRANRAPRLVEAPRLDDLDGVHLRQRRDRGDDGRDVDRATELEPRSVEEHPAGRPCRAEQREAAFRTSAGSVPGVAQSSRDTSNPIARPSITYASVPSRRVASAAAASAGRAVAASATARSTRVVISGQAPVQDFVAAARWTSGLAPAMAAWSAGRMARLGCRRFGRVAANVVERSGGSAAGRRDGIARAEAASHDLPARGGMRSAVFRSRTVRTFAGALPRSPPPTSYAALTLLNGGAAPAAGGESKRGREVVLDLDDGGEVACRGVEQGREHLRVRFLPRGKRDVEVEAVRPAVGPHREAAAARAFVSAWCAARGELEGRRRAGRIDALGNDRRERARPVDEAAVVCGRDVAARDGDLAEAEGVVHGDRERERQRLVGAPRHARQAQSGPTTAAASGSVKGSVVRELDDLRRTAGSRLTKCVGGRRPALLPSRPLRVPADVLDGDDLEGEEVARREPVVAQRVGLGRTSTQSVAPTARRYRLAPVVDRDLGERGARRQRRAGGRVRPGGRSIVKARAEPGVSQATSLAKTSTSCPFRRHGHVHEGARGCPSENAKSTRRAWRRTDVRSRAVSRYASVATRSRR